MELDINTPKGQISLQQEERMLKYISECWNLDIVNTKKEGDAVCDGFLIKNDTVVGLFESKCRNLSLIELEDYGSWLVTHEKIEKCRLLSEYLRVPFIGFLRLNKSNIVMYWKITDDKGQYLFDFEHMKTETQKTINGGTIIRDNAFLPYQYGEFVQSKRKK